MSIVKITKIISDDEFYNKSLSSVGNQLDIFLEDMGFCRTADLTEEEGKRLDEVIAWEDSQVKNGCFHQTFDSEKGVPIINGTPMPKDLYEDGKRLREKMYDGFHYLRPADLEEGLEVVKKYGDKEFAKPIPRGAKMYFTYPLSCCVVVETTEELKRPSDFVKAFCEAYQEIYTIEDESIKNVEAAHIPGMYNRNQTDGCFGIWGHDLEDLVLEDVSFYDGGRHITFMIGS